MADSQRLFSYDLVRAVAIIFVVAVHSLTVVDDLNPLCSWYIWTCQMVFFTGNALFFLLSGKFNLRERKTDVAFSSFYVKKVQTILVPILIIFFIRTLYELFPNWSLPEIVKAFAVNTVYGFNNMEYWFMYSLVGFLLVAPFLARAVTGLSKLQIKYFLAIGFGYNAVLFVLDNMGIPFGWSYLFSGFAFAFLLGPMIETVVDTDCKYHILLALGGASLAISVLLISMGYRENVYDTSPLYTVLAMAIYMFLLRLGNRIKQNKALSFIAKHSFSIYLVHMMVLHPVFQFAPMLAGPFSILVHIGFTATVFIASLALAVLIDKVLLDPAKSLFGRLFKRISTKNSDC